MIDPKKGPSRPARWGRGFSRLNFRRVAECDLALRWLDPQAGERILDVGCGDGYYDWRISRSGARVTGIDLHEARLTFARRRYGGEGAEFLRMDAEAADLSGGAFDKALSLCVLEHLGDDERVLRNIARVMKPGGRLVLTADSLTSPGITPAERERHRRRYAVNAFYTPALIREKLSRSGFEVERTDFVLSSARALRLVRASWRLDELPAGLAFLRPPGYLALGALYATLSLFPGPAPGPASGGLTIVAKARRRPE
jgi:SAM-dependent methyltransferase